LIIGLLSDPALEMVNYIRMFLNKLAFSFFMTLGAGKNFQMQEPFNSRYLKNCRTKGSLGPSYLEKKNRFKEVPVPGISKTRRVS
jgi:hypothetical protein